MRSNVNSTSSTEIGKVTQNMQHDQTILTNLKMMTTLVNLDVNTSNSRFTDMSTQDTIQHHHPILMHTSKLDNEFYLANFIALFSIALFLFTAAFNEKNNVDGINDNDDDKLVFYSLFDFSSDIQTRLYNIGMLVFYTILVLPVFQQPVVNCFLKAKLKFKWNEHLIIDPWLARYVWDNVEKSATRSSAMHDFGLGIPVFSWFKKVFYDTYLIELVQKYVRNARSNTDEINKFLFTNIPFCEYDFIASTLGSIHREARQMQ